MRDNSLDRKSNRISEYNYSQDGFYFVTVCTQNRVNYFGEISDEKMILNECGKVIKDRWLWLQEQYSYIKLDYFVVMPNHFHGILIIDRSLNVGEEEVYTFTADGYYPTKEDVSQALEDKAVAMICKITGWEVPNDWRVLRERKTDLHDIPICNLADWDSRKYANKQKIPQRDENNVANEDVPTHEC